jgi:hypothetical protein
LAGARVVERLHGDVNVFEDAARGNADYAVRGFDEIIAFATAMLASEMVDETEIRVKLLGIDQKASAVGIPFF